jgi:lipoyl(octanoyl) transferase
MIVDEWLAQKVAADGPILRFYGWTEPTLSIGCFVPWEEAIAFAPELDIVRRWTGGGMVEHGKDWTWSLAVPRPSVAALEGPTAQTYEVVHRCLQEALKRCGISTTLAPPRSASSPLAAPCFATPVESDLMRGRQKIAGSAQRRTRDVLLVQGSIAHADLPVTFGATFAATLGQEVRMVELEYRLNEGGVSGSS